MPTTSISVSVQTQRMMSRADAAHYCGMKANKFDQLCPVNSVQLPNGNNAWDVHDLDKWLDSLKEDRTDSLEQMITRLA